METLEHFKRTVVVHLMMRILSVNSSENCCWSNVSTVVCEGCIPLDVPANISEVAIFATEFSKYANTSNFQGKNWDKIKTLVMIPEEYWNGSKVENTYARFSLTSKMFVNLSTLISLKFSSRRLNKMDDAVFQGLSKLEKLDLSYCSEITLPDIIRGIQGSYLPNLRFLNLRNTSQLSTLVSFFDGKFFSALSPSRLEHIDFSYTMNSVMDAEGFSSAFPNLKSLNFEHGGYLAVNFVVSCIEFGNGPTFTNLKSINVNFPKIPDAVITAENDDLRMESSYVQNFTEVHVRGCTPVEAGFSSHVYGTRLNSSVRVGLHFVGTEVIWNTLHLIVSDDDAIAVEILDIADNSVEHIDSSITTLGKNIKHFDVSVNRLFKMNEALFEVMLHNMTMLEVFNCSHNGLESVPRESFKYSLRLKIIDLSHNLIKSLDVDIFHLIDLELLDLSGNLIHFLTQDGINKYQFLFSSDLNMKVKINITRNPFVCTCQTIDFVRWLSLLDEHSVFYNEEKFTCNLDGDGEIPVDTKAVSEVDYLCKRPYIIIATSISAVACILIAIAISVYCYRRYRKKKREANLRQRIEIYKSERKSKRNAKEFPVFLSYSSSDAQIVDHYVLPALNENLQRILETDERCVVTGDLCFTPGFHVAEEIVKCIESCNVLMACVSRDFCQSVFCEDELLAAKHDNIPMILLFLEEVDMKKLPKTIQTHFKTITRTKLTVTESSTPVFTPSIDKICEGIIKLMKTDMKKSNLRNNRYQAEISL